MKHSRVINAYKSKSKGLNNLASVNDQFGSIDQGKMTEGREDGLKLKGTSAVRERRLLACVGSRSQSGPRHLFLNLSPRNPSIYHPSALLPPTELTPINHGVALNANTCMDFCQIASPAQIERVYIRARSTLFSSTSRLEQLCQSQLQVIHRVTAGGRRNDRQTAC